MDLAIPTKGTRCIDFLEIIDQAPDVYLSYKRKNIAEESDTEVPQI